MMRFRLQLCPMNAFNIMMLFSFSFYFNISALANDPLTELSIKREQWLDVVLDSSMFPCAPYTPSKKLCHPDDNILPAGDMVLFNALLCQSGYQASCFAVLRSQEASGRWRRSPLHVNKPVHHEAGIFSKDHVLGLLIYFLTTEDRESATKWYSWLENVSPRTFPYAMKVCEKVHCVITPNLFSLMFRVWRELGLRPSSQMSMHRYAANDRSLTLEAKRLSGYQLHLKAVAALLLNLLDERPQHLINLLIKKQPDNPFYQYLAESPKEGVAENMLDKCRVITDESYRENSGHQWSWERDTEEEAWRYSMGWDCIFMANTLLGY
ncbi:MAG: hypothetical protein R3B45_15285 [Bdellovibrionota bacterium]